jgi:hypothetical protein
MGILNRRPALRPTIREPYRTRAYEGLDDVGNDLGGWEVRADRDGEGSGSATERIFV